VVSASPLKGSASFSVSAGAADDNVPQNNLRSKWFTVLGTSDLAVRVDQASVTGASAAPSHFHQFSSRGRAPIPCSRDCA
jgi:hypothetical protein